jgi:hypothetical protein
MPPLCNRNRQHCVLSVTVRLARMGVTARSWRMTEGSVLHRATPPSRPTYTNGVTLEPPPLHVREAKRNSILEETFELGERVVGVIGVIVLDVWAIRSGHRASVRGDVVQVRATRGAQALAIRGVQYGQW